MQSLERNCLFSAHSSLPTRQVQFFTKCPSSRGETEQLPWWAFSQRSSSKYRQLHHYGAASGSVVSAGYRVPGCEIQEQFLCSPPCAPKGVTDGMCSQPLALGLSFSEPWSSFLPQTLTLSSVNFLSTSHLSSWVILSSDANPARASLGPLGRASSLR